MTDGLDRHFTNDRTVNQLRKDCHKSIYKCLRLTVFIRFFTIIFYRWQKTLRSRTCWFSSDTVVFVKTLGRVSTSGHPFHNFLGSVSFSQLLQASSIISLRSISTLVVRCPSQFWQVISKHFDINVSILWCFHAQLLGGPSHYCSHRHDIYSQVHYKEESILD
jgi:hypothetical protein